MNQRLGQVLAGTVVSTISNITLPKPENLVDKVVLEEFHRGQNVEHGGLLHPFRQREELSRNDFSLVDALVTSTRLVSVDLDNTMRRDGEVLAIEGIIVIFVNYYEVVGTELRDGHL